MLFWKNFNKNNLIVAHRGWRSEYPENTLLAFNASLGHCDFIELDVAFTKDGEAVIIHDDTLVRTSNAEALPSFSPPYNVSDYTYAQLSELDMSSWFCPMHDNGAEPCDIQRILKLEEILLFCKKHHLPVNVEMKDVQGSNFHDDATWRVLSTIKTLEVESLVLLSSFNHDYLKQARTLSPELSLAALQNDAHLYTDIETLISYLKGLSVKAYHVTADMVTQDLIAALHQAGIFVNIYTVNEVTEKERLFSIGVKSIFTDILE